MSQAGSFTNKYVYIAGTSGGIAVSVFMIISGYVIAHLLLGKNENYRSYLVRRFFRIFPIYLVACIAAVLLRQWYETAFIDPAWLDSSAARASRLASEHQFLWAHILAHAALLHGAIPDSLLPYASTAFLAPAWSLSLEWQFYLLAPVFLMVCITLPWRSAVVFWIAVCLVSVPFLFGLVGFWDVPSALPLVLNYFLIGIATRLALGGALRGGGLVLLPAILVLTAFQLSNTGAYGILSFVVAMMVWGAAIMAIRGEMRPKGNVLDGVLRLIFHNGFMIWVGQISYSTYLMHIPIFIVSTIVATRMFGFETNPTTYLVTFAVSLPVVMLVSWGAYRSLEMPGIKIGRWLAAAGSAAPRAVPDVAMGVTDAHGAPAVQTARH